MSNGVELIIASDNNKIKSLEKSKANVQKIYSNFSQQSKPILITQTHHKPLTLSPSTLQNQMMILTLPLKNQSILMIPDNDNSFVTKICLTTYTYRTSLVRNGTTQVESKKMVITNSLTEERKYSHLIPDVTFSKTPELIVGLFPTTYHFYNTFDKNQESLPLVVTSKYTIINTITGSDLRISESVLPSYYTNTYFSRIIVTQTLYDDNGLEKPLKTITSENYLTQVIITETPFFPNEYQQVIQPTSIINKKDSNKFNGSFSTKSNTQIIKNVFTDGDYYLLASNLKSKNSETTKESLYTYSTSSFSSVQLPKDSRKSHTLASNNATKLTKHNNPLSTEIKPSKLYNNLLNSHSKIESTFNLAQLRPMLTAVAQLLKKQLINTNMAETRIKRKPDKPSSTNINPMMSESTLYYIPLEQTRKDKSNVAQPYSNLTNRRRENTNNLRINTLHIEPPKLPRYSSKNSPKEGISLPIQSFSLPRQHLFKTSVDIAYDFLTTGIPIRPGEVITASADVIFGRPPIPPGYYSTLRNRYLATLMPSIPFLDLRSITIRNDNVLKPPPIPIHKQPLLLNRSSHDFTQQSMDPYVSPKWKTAFYSNQILDIFRVPQIFSTRIQDTASYALKSTLSTLFQQVNLRNDVLSHTINIHAAPITFKREMDAHSTAFRGQPKNYDVTLKSKDLTTSPKYETKSSNIRSPENIKKGIGITKNISPYLSKQEENPESFKGNYADQNADYSHDSLHLVNPILKKRNEFLDRKPFFNDWIFVTTNLSKKALSKSTSSTIIITNSSYTQQKSQKYAVRNSNVMPYINLTRLSLIKTKNPNNLILNKEIGMQTSLIETLENSANPNELTLNKEIGLQTSLIETLENSAKYLKVIPVTNQALLRSTKELFIWNPQVMRSSSTINSLQTTFKLLEPSENLQNELSKKPSLNLLATTKAQSTWKSIRYYNILKPTKTSSMENIKSILKTTTTKSLLTIESQNIHLNTDNMYITKNGINTSNRNNGYNTNKTVNIKKPISSIQILNKKNNNLKGVDKPLKNIVLSDTVTLNRSEILDLDYTSQKSKIITETSIVIGIVENIERKNLNNNAFNNFTTTDANSEAFVINYPPKAENYLKTSSDNDCRPSCKSNKNEICVSITSNDTKLEEHQCVCRPSFGRMFPDRPCKPTYTYEMQIQVNFAENHYLRLNDILRSNKILLDAADRMLMQSDLRDIYHNVQVKAVISTKHNDSLIVQFILQLSENSNENQLKTIFQKYLRQSNFSIGNTGLFSSKNGLDLLAIKDFDECISENFNDCSMNAYCFNLIGSYTCSCKNGHIDISDNALYPGRICSDNTIGCDICNYHGKCILTERKNVKCICHSWYAGTQCQVNLKIIAIFIIISGTILAIFLLFYFLLINTSRKRKNAFFNTNTLQTSMITTTESHKNDTTSQSSQGSSLSLKKCHGVKAIPIRNMYDILNIRNAVDNHVKPYQAERSIALMIPRAKYCWPYIYSQHHHRLNNNQDTNRSLPDMTWKSVIHKHDLTMNPGRPQGSYSKRTFDLGIQPKIETTLVRGGFQASNAYDIKLEDVGSEETTEINDANAMTERDLGSTFLLPHTHLYKPDQMPCNFSGVESAS